MRKNLNFLKIGMSVLVFCILTGRASADTDEMDGVPVYCNAMIGLNTQQLGCAGFNRGNFLRTRIELLNLRMSSFETEKQLKNWVGSNTRADVCGFNTQWSRGLVKFKFTGHLGDTATVSNSQLTFDTVEICTNGVVVVASDSASRIGPAVFSKTVKKATLAGLDSVHPTKKVLYYIAHQTSAASSPVNSKPTVTADYVVSNCYVGSKGESDTVRTLECSGDPNTEEFCEPRWFAAPTKNFHYKGWWWVRGPKTGKAPSKSKHQVCTHGVQKASAQEVADQTGVVQQLKSNVTLSNLDFTSRIATKLFAKEDFLENIRVNAAYTAVSSATAAATPNYYFKGIAKCKAPNPTIGNVETWYTCTNARKRQALSRLTSEDDASLVITDSSEYEIADHTEREAECVIRAPIVSGFTPTSLIYEIGDRTYITKYGGGAGRNIKDIFFNWTDEHNVLKRKPAAANTYLTAGPYSPEFYGPLVAAGKGAAGIVLSNYGKGGQPVKFAPCSDVQIVMTKKFKPVTPE